MFAQDGQASFGPLPTDRPHQGKVQFLYQLPFGTAIGVSQIAQSGVPITGEIAVLPPNNFPVQIPIQARFGVKFSF